MESLRSEKRKPTHPGAILREDVLKELKLSQTELADRLNVSRRTISQIIHEKRPITIDMAIRLAHFLGGTAKGWMNMQLALDLWELEKKHHKKYELIKRYENITSKVNHHV